MSLESSERDGTGEAVQKEPVDLLTQRELQVLHLIVEGKSNKEIAWNLGISINMVKAHVSHVFQKLDVASRTQAAVVFVRSGWNKRGEEPVRPEEKKGA